MPAIAIEKEMREILSCTRCSGIFASTPVNPRAGDERVVPRPIVPVLQSRPVMLIGQAPGLEEYRSGKPFQGDAGQKIREIFDVAGLPKSHFDRLVYSSAVIKCFPGSKPPKEGRPREDVAPNAQMIRNCQPWLSRQLEIAQPKLIVTLGGLPLKRILAMMGKPVASVVLKDYVGKSLQWNDKVVVPFPHTSGASRWHNAPENKVLFRQAWEMLRRAFIEQEIAEP